MMRLVIRHGRPILALHGTPSRPVYTSLKRRSSAGTADVRRDSSGGKSKAMTESEMIVPGWGVREATGEWTDMFDRLVDEHHTWITEVLQEIRKTLDKDEVSLLPKTPSELRQRHTSHVHSQVYISNLSTEQCQQDTLRRQWVFNVAELDDNSDNYNHLSLVNDKPWIYTGLEYSNDLLAIHDASSECEENTWNSDAPLGDGSDSKCGFEQLTRIGDCVQDGEVSKQIINVCKTLHQENELICCKPISITFATAVTDQVQSDIRCSAASVCYSIDSTDNNIDNCDSHLTAVIESPMPHVLPDESLKENQISPAGSGFRSDQKKSQRCTPRSQEKRLSASKRSASCLALRNELKTEHAPDLSMRSESRLCWKKLKVNEIFENIRHDLGFKNCLGKTTSQTDAEPENYFSSDVYSTPLGSNLVSPPNNSREGTPVTLCCSFKSPRSGVDSFTSERYTSFSGAAVKRTIKDVITVKDVRVSRDICDSHNQGELLTDASHGVKTSDDVNESHCPDQLPMPANHAVALSYDVRDSYTTDVSLVSLQRLSCVTSSDTDKNSLDIPIPIDIDSDEARTSDCDTRSSSSESVPARVQPVPAHVQSMPSQVQTTVLNADESALVSVHGNDHQCETGSDSVTRSIFTVGAERYDIDPCNDAPNKPGELTTKCDCCGNFDKRVGGNENETAVITCDLHSRSVPLMTTDFNRDIFISHKSGLSEDLNSVNIQIISDDDADDMATIDSGSISRHSFVAVDVPTPRSSPSFNGESHKSLESCDISDSERADVLNDLSSFADSSVAYKSLLSSSSCGLNQSESSNRSAADQLSAERSEMDMSFYAVRYRSSGAASSTDFTDDIKITARLSDSHVEVVEVAKTCSNMSASKQNGTSNDNEPLMLRKGTDTSIGSTIEAGINVQSTRNSSRHFGCLSATTRTSVNLSAIEQSKLNRSLEIITRQEDNAAGTRIDNSLQFWSTAKGDKILKSSAESGIDLTSPCRSTRGCLTLSKSSHSGRLRSVKTCNDLRGVDDNKSAELFVETKSCYESETRALKSCSKPLTVVVSLKDSSVVSLTYEASKSNVLFPASLPEAGSSHKGLQSQVADMDWVGTEELNTVIREVSRKRSSTSIEYDDISHHIEPPAKKRPSSIILATDRTTRGEKCVDESFAEAHETSEISFSIKCSVSNHLTSMSTAAEVYDGVLFAKESLASNSEKDYCSLAKDSLTGHSEEKYYKSKVSESDGMARRTASSIDSSDMAMNSEAGYSIAGSSDDGYSKMGSIMLGCKQIKDPARRMSRKRTSSCISDDEENSSTLSHQNNAIPDRLTNVRTDRSSQVQAAALARKSLSKHRRSGMIAGARKYKTAAGERGAVSGTVGSSNGGVRKFQSIRQQKQNSPSSVTAAIDRAQDTKTRPPVPTFRPILCRLPTTTTRRSGARPSILSRASTASSRRTSTERWGWAAKPPPLLPRKKIVPPLPTTLNTPRPERASKGLNENLKVMGTGGHGALSYKLPPPTPPRNNVTSLIPLHGLVSQVMPVTPVPLRRVENLTVASNNRGELESRSSSVCKLDVHIEAASSSGEGETLSSKLTKSSATAATSRTDSTRSRMQKLQRMLTPKSMRSDSVAPVSSLHQTASSQPTASSAAPHPHLQPFTGVHGSHGGGGTVEVDRKPVLKRWKGDEGGLAKTPNAGTFRLSPKKLPSTLIQCFSSPRRSSTLTTQHAAGSRTQLKSKPSATVYSRFNKNADRPVDTCSTAGAVERSSLVKHGKQHSGALQVPRDNNNVIVGTSGSAGIKRTPVTALPTRPQSPRTGLFRRLQEKVRPTSKRQQALKWLDGFNQPTDRILRVENLAAAIPLPPVPPTSTNHSVSPVKQPSTTALNNPSSYHPRSPPPPLSHPLLNLGGAAAKEVPVGANICDNYNIADINSDDSTDDEGQPKRIIPTWAQGTQLMSTLLDFHYRPVDCQLVFGRIYAPDLNEMFDERKPRFDKRTSSANWEHPMYSSALDVARYNLGNQYQHV